MYDDTEEPDEDIQVVILEVDDVVASLSEYLDGGSGVKSGRNRLFQQMFSAVQG